MKRRSREISIFSMSALDLFASALGAFILLTVIMLPYFPNTGDSPEMVAAVKAELEAEIEDIETELAESEAEATAAKAAAAAAEAAAADAEARAAAASAEAAKAKADADAQKGKLKFPAIDVVVVLDTTGSMTNQVEGLKADLNNFFDVLLGLSESPALGIVDYKDKCDPTPVRVQPLKAITKADQSTYRRFASQMYAGSKCSRNDVPESVDLALARAVPQNWRPEAQRRVIIVISDAEAHPETYERTFSQAAGFRRSGGQVSAVFVQTGGGDPATAERYLRTLAQRGGGSYYPGGASFIGSVLVALLS